MQSLQLSSFLDCDGLQVKSQHKAFDVWDYLMGQSLIEIMSNQRHILGFYCLETYETARDGVAA